MSVNQISSGAEEVQLQIDGAVYELLINRPNSKNALSAEMYATLAELLDKADRDPGCRVVLLRGAGGVFSSGHDLKDFMDNPPAEDGSSAVNRFMRSLYHCKKPVIAAVQGLAMGIGATLLPHCDLVYASDSAMFQLPFVNLGLCPEYGSSLFLSQAGGRLRASEVLLLGERFDSELARELGLVNRVVADDQLLAMARERAQRLAQQPPRAVQEAKKLLREPQFAQGEQVIRRELELFLRGLKSDEFNEAVTAFIEKRPPDFSRF